MAWIESHQSLGAHPKTKKLARLLNVPLPQVIGHLHMLWWWAFDYAQDGDLSRYAAEDIADAVLWEGSASLLMASLLDAGFLDQPNGKPCIHDWDEYGGKLLAKRRADAQRKENARNSESVQRTSSGRPTDILRTAQVEEKRGEDIEEKRGDRAPDGADDPPLPVREIRDTVLSKLPQKYQRDALTIDEALDFARDFAGQHLEVSKAISACRRANELPFPGNLRKHLTPTTPAPAAAVQPWLQPGAREAADEARRQRIESRPADWYEKERERELKLARGET